MERLFNRGEGQKKQEANQRRFLLCSSGSEDFDRSIGGGIPLETLLVIIGGGGSGKSVICQQFVFGALKENRTVSYITSQQTISSLLSNMKNLSYDVEEHFLNDKLKVIPVHTRYGSIEHDHDKLEVLGRYIQKQNADLVIVDSLSYFANLSDDDDVFRFFITCKRYTDKKKMLFVTIPDFFVEAMPLGRTANICDTIMRIRKEEVGDKIVRILQIEKIKTLGDPFQELIAFEIDPAFGIRVSPILTA